MSFKGFLLVAAAASFAAPALANIDTTGSDIGTIFSFGAPDTATYGQTFTPGAGDTQLSTFSMYLRNRSSGSGTLDLRGYIATWDGTKAATILYSSPTQTMNNAGTLQEFAFAPNITVTPGQQLVAFLSISGLPTQSGSTFGMPEAADLIPGAFVYLNNGTNFAALTTTPWSQGYAGTNDVWLKVGFNGVAGVPEPATWALMIGGFGLAGAAMRRRARTVTYA